MNNHSNSAYLASEKAMADLRSVNDLFIENFVRNDVKSHDAILHADFVAVQSNGSRLDRAAYLERWATGFDPKIILYWDLRDELINIVGDVALVRATNKYIMWRNSDEISGMTTYTDTYIYENDRWLCIQAQMTPVATGHEPADDTIISIYVNGARLKSRI